MSDPLADELRQILRETLHSPDGKGPIRDFVAALQARGVVVRPNVSLTTDAFNGLGYTYGGKDFAPDDIERNTFRLKALREHGLTVGPDDIVALRALRQQQIAAASGLSVDEDLPQDDEHQRVVRDGLRKFAEAVPADSYTLYFHRQDGTASSMIIREPEIQTISLRGIGPGKVTIRPMDPHLLLIDNLSYEEATKLPGVIVRGHETSATWVRLDRHLSEPNRYREVAAKLREIIGAKKPGVEAPEGGASLLPGQRFTTDTYDRHGQMIFPVRLQVSHGSDAQATAARLQEELGLPVHVPQAPQVAAVQAPASKPKRAGGFDAIERRAPVNETPEERGRRMCREQVARHLDLLPAETYRVQIVAQGTEKEVRDANYTGLTREQILEKIDTYRGLNAHGGAICVRPEDNRYILLDDIRSDAQLRDIGEAVMVVETSPGNRQVWLRLRAEPGEIDDVTHTQIARQLARRFEADPGAAQHNQVGRLLGFRNRKAKHITDRNLAPMVRLVSADRKERSDSAAIIAAAKAEVAKMPKMDVAALLRGGSGLAAPSARYRRSNGVSEDGYRVYGEHVIDFAERQMDEIMRNPPIKTDGSIDRSRVDFRLASKCYARGFSGPATVDVVLAMSDKADQAGLRYVNTTVTNAFTRCDARVAQQREGQSQEGDLRQPQQTVRRRRGM